MRQRGAVGTLGRAEATTLELEVAEQRLYVRAVLGHVAAGGQRGAHRVDGTRQVAMELAEVRNACVRGKRRLDVDPALKCAAGLVIAAEFDERADQHRVRRRQLRR